MTRKETERRIAIRNVIVMVIMIAACVMAGYGLVLLVQWMEIFTTASH